MVGHVAGYGRNIDRLKAASAKGVLDSYDTDPARVCRGADLIVLATPVGTFKALVAQVKDSLKDGALLVDVGSVKGGLVAEIEDLLPGGVSFVPCHPIAGSERSGFEEANPELFEGADCIITRTENTSDEAFNTTSAMWEALGSNVKLMSPDEHDLVYGLVSHLPHVIAYALVNTVARVDPEYIEMAGSGFKDTTRIAASSASLWRDICSMNRENLVRFIRILREDLDTISLHLKTGNMDDLEEEFAHAEKLRRNLEG